MTLVKHSQRTVRKGCKYCGDKELYWAHDTSVVSAKHCDECGCNDGKWVLVDKFMRPHVQDCTGQPTPRPASSPDAPKEETVTPVETTPEIVAEASAAPAASPTNPPAVPDAYAAFQALLGAMTPQLDPQQIRDLVKEELGQVLFPTRTVIQTSTGDVKPVEGTAHKMVGDVITDLFAGEHVMMVGPAGTGKSTIAEQAAETLGLTYYSISLSPQTPASQILGYMQAQGEYVRSLFREGYEHGGVFHFDEIDNAHPSTLAVINAALANGAMAFPDGMVKRHDDFRCVASANTYGKGADRQYVGRQQIDAATLDRFTIETIEIDEALEYSLCMSTGLETSQVSRVLTAVRKYRKNALDKRMTVVISPRASVGMCRLLAAGKSWEAAMEARVRRGMSDADWAKLIG